MTTAKLCPRQTCPTACAYPFCLDKTPVSERAALQADLDIAAGKFTGRYQKRRDDAAVRAQMAHQGQTRSVL